jgi:DNA (cytosine-5)-methyltransferase 1
MNTCIERRFDYDNLGVPCENMASLASTTPSPPSRLNVISLFTGMGGMDLGFTGNVIVRPESVPPAWIDPASPERSDGFVALSRLPFNVVFQNDILPQAQRLADINNWSCGRYELKDIRMCHADPSFVFPDAHVVIGGFPCQDFSHAGRRQGFATERGTLYQAFVETVRRVHPIVFVAENVEGLLTMPGAPLDRIKADMRSVGYTVHHHLLRAEEYGIPQTRHRVFIFGLREDVAPPPDWTTQPPPFQRVPLCVYFAHLDEPDVATDPAQRVYSKAARLDSGQGQQAVDMKAPGPTMRAEHHGNIEFRRHGENERRLTVREAALIQTFPPDCLLTFPPRPTMVAYKPIGNAVPPLLAYIVARKVLSAFMAV